MSSRISATIDDSLKECIAEESNEWNTSEAEVIREALNFAFSEESGFDTEIADHHLENLEWERMKEEHRPAQRMKYFPSEVKDKFEEDFEKGLGKPAFEITRDNFFDQIDRTSCIDREQADSYRMHVWKWYTRTVEASQQTAYDPLDPDNHYEHYDGVETGKAEAEIEAEITEHVDEAVDLITDEIGGRLGDSATDPEQVIEILSNRSDIPDGAAEDIVNYAVGVIEGDTSIEEISVDTSPGASDRAATDGGDR